MKLNKILCPTDYSLYSKSANYYASLFARAYDAEIIYFHVATLPATVRDLDDNLDELYLELGRNVRPFFQNLRHNFAVRIGNPATEIVALAHEKKVELIVIGTHGRTGADHLLHGSICEKVLRLAACPVMAVKTAFAVDWVLPDREPLPCGDSPQPVRFRFS